MVNCGMKLLIVAATEGEIAPFRKLLKDQNLLCDVLVTGVGMIATTYALTRHLQANTYDFVLQVGVCGSFDRNLPLGQLVFITSEEYGDLGAEDHETYLDIFEMGLIGKDELPHAQAQLRTPILRAHDNIMLPRVKGLTVNTVSGNETTIAKRAQKWGCDVESMEGAAFHYACLQENIPFAQVRAISNYVIPRDKSQWRMKEGIINLNKWLIAFYNEFGNSI